MIIKNNNDKLKVDVLDFTGIREAKARRPDSDTYRVSFVREDGIVDPYSATRAAIVLAAEEIGKRMV